MKKIIISFIFSLVIFSLFRLQVSAGQNGTTLTATKTASGHMVRKYGWDIEKTVNPGTWDLFRGDTGTSEYSVTVTKDSGTDDVFVDGEICITNGGTVTTEGLSVTDNLTIPSSAAIISTVVVDTSSNPVLEPGQTHCYPYKITIPAAHITPGAAYKDTADITISNHSGHLGTPFGPSPSATSSLPAAYTLINDEITVSDTNGYSWKFYDNGSVHYDKTFTCDSDQGNHPNTVTIDETGQTDSVDVTVHCFSLDVAKTATTSLKRTYTWNIKKAADPPAITLALNQEYPVHYTVTIDKTSADSDWAAAGKITVENQTPADAVLNSVSDMVSGGIQDSDITVSCDKSFPYTLEAGETLECPYTVFLPNTEKRINTGTATLQNYSYNKDGKQVSGTTGFSGTADISFTQPIIEEIDECTDVSDTLQGKLGKVCVQDTPKAYTYTRNIGPYITCGSYKVDNIAAFTADDTYNSGLSAASVSVNIPCFTGCTLTTGYWKNHAGFGPQKDMVSDNLPVTLGSCTSLLTNILKAAGITSTCSVVKVNSRTVANNILSMNSLYGAPSNGITKLYAQLLAAKLNIRSGASLSPVSQVINDADAFLGKYSYTAWDTLSKTDKNMVHGWVSFLDAYNNGLKTVPHCNQ